jgi:Flp pilus assembly protein TadD
MTVNSVNFGRKAVILSVVGAVVVMFVASFVYRMNHPNLFVKVKQTRQQSAEQGATPPSGMGAGMGGNMAQVKEFMARVETNPDDVEALINLGNSFLMMRAWDRALPPLEKANELKQGNTEVLKAIGIAYFNKEDFVKATAAYDEILEIDPNDTLALFNLGVIHKHYFKKSDQARVYFEKILILEKEDMEMRKLAKQELEN